MALYSELPVYKATYDLMLLLFQFTKEFNKEYKYTIGESIKKEMLELMTNVYRANSGLNTASLYIQRARENCEAVRLFIRLLKDLHQVTIKKFAQLSIQIESVSRQLAGWQKSTERRVG